MKKKTKLTLFLLFIFLLSACSSTAFLKKKRATQTGGRLLVYFYLPDSKPVDVSFAIKKIEIKKGNGTWQQLSDQALVINAVQMAGRQVKLCEAIIPPGIYTELRLTVSNPGIRWENARRSLALPVPQWDISIGKIDLPKNKTAALFLEWNPAKSVVNNYLFNLKAEHKKPRTPPRNLLMYVTNSESDHVSVIDRFENRVVGILNTAKNPTEIVLSKEKEKAYVLNSGSGIISIINTVENYVEDKITFISGHEPVDMAMIPYVNKSNEGKLYIANRGSDNVTIIDTVSKRQVKTVKVGDGPREIVANPDRHEVYVVNSDSNTISVIDSQSDRVKLTINLETKPADIILIQDKMYVLHTVAGRISIVDIRSGQVTKTIPGGLYPQKGVYSQLYDRLFLSSYRTGSMSFLIPASGTVTRTIKLGKKPLQLVVDEDRNRIYVTGFGVDSIYIVNPDSEKLEGTIAVGKGQHGIILIN